jgi:murein DD-endopeptidase MepM/ murein hydrolase activator NlpD
MNTRNLKIKKFSTILSIVFLVSIFTCSFTPNLNAASTVEELQAKIDEKNKNIEALNKEIQLYADLTDKTSKEAQTLQKKIQTLTQNGKMLDVDIKKTKTKIDVANIAIQKLGMNIQASEDKVSHYQEVISTEVKNIQFKESASLIENILGKRNLSDVLIEVDNLRTLNQKLGEEIDSLRDEKKTLEVNKIQKEDTKKELTTLQAELSGKKKVVEENKKEQGQILKETKNQEKTYQQILAQRKAEKEALDKELFDYESTLKYTLNPSLIPNKSSAKVLSWPLDTVRISQLFGKTSASARLYVSGTHNGVDFGAKVGTPLKAMSAGVIAGAGDTDLTCKGASFGRWVLIKFNNGLAATYGHMSVISVTEGQKVSAGEIIGYSGNTGYSTGPHLHISVYDASVVSAQTRPSVSCGGKIYRMPIAPVGAYLDPMLYLPKK